MFLDRKDPSKLLLLLLAAGLSATPGRANSTPVTNPNPAPPAVSPAVSPSLAADKAEGTAPNPSPATAQAPIKPALVDLDAKLFPVPPRLVDNIDFWTAVYSKYDSSHILIHDDLYMSAIYAVLDFTELDKPEVSPIRRENLRRERTRETLERYRALLNQMAAGKAPKSSSADAERVALLLAKAPGGKEKYRLAAGRLRSQTSLRDRFGAGIMRSGAFMAEIEQVFKARNLPLDLTRLPFVESLFQWHAKSSVAAGGIWQFMPATARIYGLRTANDVDERFDPMRATHAAARLLSDNYAALGTWPLALTAYNHGQGGMRRAVRMTGTRDLGVIAWTYQSRSFGFASRNFYAEFVAAARVYANREHYFPGLKPDTPRRFEELPLGHFTSARDLAKKTNVEIAALVELNPAVNKAVWDGRVRLPKGYKLKVPVGTLASFQNAYAGLGPQAKSAEASSEKYRVRPGDTLGRIAKRQGTSVETLRELNDLPSDHLRIGQELALPVRAAKAETVVPHETVTVVPQPSVKTASATEAVAPNAGPPPAATSGKVEIVETAQVKHVVKTGETLAAIAKRYGTTVEALRKTNRIRSHIIQPAQVLLIP